MERKRKIKILVVEDNPGDFFLVSEYLQGVADEPVITQAERLSVALNLFKTHAYDVILLDLTLPDSKGLDSVRNMLNHVNGTPLIVLTGVGNEQYGIDSLKLGAQDYLVKDEINASLLIKSVQYSIERSRVRLEMNKQDRLFRVITENSPVAKTLISTDGEIKFTTSSIKTITGFDSSECIGKNEKEMLHPDDVPVLLEHIGAAIANPDIHPQFELRIKHKDGTYRWCEKSIVNLLHDEHVNALVCTFWDITERRNANEKIASSEKRFRSLVQSGGDMIAILNTDGAYQYVSDTVTHILGFTPEYFIGKNAWDYIHPDDVDEVHQQYLELEYKHHLELKPFRFRNSKGEWRWIETVITNLAEDPSVQGIVSNSRDITDKLKAAEELKKLSLIAKETINAVVITDAHAVITWVNDAFTSITGYTFEEAIGKKPGDLLQGPKSDPRTIEYIKRKLDNKEPFETDIINYAKDGREYWIHIQCQPLFNEDGELEQFFAIETDITDAVQNQELLKISEERYRNLFEVTPASIIIFDPYSLQVLEVNTTAVKEYGYSREEFLQLTLLDYRDKEDFPAIIELAEKFTKNRNTYNKGTWKHRTKDGNIIYMDYNSHSITFNGKHAVLALGQNITEKIELEKALEQERWIKQQQITEAVISAQEKERLEIGIELHDNINQILASSRLYLGLAKTGSHDKRIYLDETDNLINSAISEIRSLSHSLIPPSLDSLALEEALEHITGSITKTTGLKIKKQYDNFIESQLPSKLKLTIYRIIQEQLNNILKYARAKTVMITLSQQNQKTLLRVSDDGTGFDTTAKRNGVGLTNMKTRASLFNGEMNVISAPGKGCTIEVTFNHP